MAAPNIVNVGTITGKSFYLALSSTSATALVSNAASSGKVFKIKELLFIVYFERKLGGHRIH